MTEETPRARIPNVRFRLLLSGLSGSRVGVELPRSHRAGRMPHPNAINANLCRALDRERANDERKEGRKVEKGQKGETFSLSPFSPPLFRLFSPFPFFCLFLCHFCFIKHRAFFAFFKCPPDVSSSEYSGISLIEEISLFNPV